MLQDFPIHCLLRFTYIYTDCILTHTSGHIYAHMLLCPLILTIEIANMAAARYCGCISYSLDSHTDIFAHHVQTFLCYLNNVTLVSFLSMDISITCSFHCKLLSVMWSDYIHLLKYCIWVEFRGICTYFPFYTALCFYSTTFQWGHCSFNSTTFTWQAVYFAE